MNFDVLMKRTLKTLTENSSVILTGVAVAGTITTSIFAAKGHADAKTYQIKSDAEYNYTVGYESRKSEDIELREYVGLYWRHYVPAVASGTMTIACIIGIHSVNSRKQAALISAYSVLDKGFENYKEKVVETLGEKKEKDVRDEVAKEAIFQNPVGDQLVIGKGTQLCYETITGRYFMSDIETVRRAENDIRDTLHHDMSASLNVFFNKIDLPSTRAGDELGWSIDRPIQVDYSSHLTDDGRPCLSIDYIGAPHVNYYKLG